MASFFLRAGILGACSLSWVAWGANVSCAEVGKAYNDSSVPLPQVYVAGEAACQAACAGDPTCKVFTYYKNTGGCWKMTDKAVVLELTNATLAKFAVSGPQSCNETATEATGGAITITDSESDTSVATKGVDVSTSKSEPKDKGGGIPMWVWLMVAAALCILMAHLTVYFNSKTEIEDGGKTKKKEAESTTRGVAVDAAEAISSAEAVAPLAPAGLPQMAPVPSFSQCQAVMQGGQVLQQAPKGTMYFVQQPAQQHYQMQPQIYMPMQQGYEYELSNQAPLQPMQMQGVFSAGSLRVEAPTYP